MPSKFSVDNLPYRFLFEVYGRHYGPEVCEMTVAKANKVYVKGFVCEKFRIGIRGEVQGFPGPLLQMKRWLSEGPSSYYKVSKVIFKDIRRIDDFTYPDFIHIPNYY